MTEHPDDRRATTSGYEIRLGVRLGAGWATRFDPLTLITAADGTTSLRGPVPDQASLHGLLGTIRDFGLPLVADLPIDPDPPA